MYLHIQALKTNVLNYSSPLLLFSIPKPLSKHNISILPRVKHRQQKIQLHLLPHFHSHRNHPNMTSNFHHHHLQNIQTMPQYHYATKQQDFMSKYKSPPQFLQHREEKGLDHPQFLLVSHRVAFPPIPSLYIPPGMHACQSCSNIILQQRSSCVDCVLWPPQCDHIIYVITRFVIYNVLVQYRYSGTFIVRGNKKKIL
jgi:hypothetical protein